MITKINNITCLQETKWLKTKSREIENTRYRLQLTGKKQKKSIEMRQE